MSGWTHDPELADDVIGVASARLLALGIPRGERLRALRLLSILTTLADRDRTVRRPLAMVASEFDLPADEVDVWLDDLVAIGVVRLDGDGMVLAGAEPPRPGSISLHDFLDAAAEVDDDAVVVAPPPRRARALLLRPSAALAVAAAVAALALVAPAVVDDRSTPASSTRDERQTPVVPTTAGQGKAPARSTTTTEAEDEAVPGGTRIGPVVVPTTTIPALPCPDGAPILEVIGATTGADGRLTVDGIARNPSAEQLAVQTFTLRTTVGGQEITAPGTDRPLVVPPQGEILWQARLPVVAPAGTPVRAALGDWEWQVSGVPSTCPSP